MDKVQRCSHEGCHVPASRKRGYSWTCGNHEQDKRPLSKQERRDEELARNAMATLDRAFRPKED